MGIRNAPSTRCPWWLKRSRPIDVEMSSRTVSAIARTYVPTTITETRSEILDRNVNELNYRTVVIFEWPSSFKRLAGLDRWV